MSMTKEQAIEEFNDTSEYYAESGNRLKNGALDDHYIAAFENNPLAKKIDLLRIAIKAAGLDMNATRQRAYEIHNRLSETLDKRLIRAAKDARRLGLNVVTELARSADSESVRGQMGLALCKDLFPEVQIVKTETATDLDEQLERNTKELEQLTGNKSH